ncbi:MAG: hypothetical protein R3B60_02525 [Candidatus Paceibacterota bacterium]
MFGFLSNIRILYVLIPAGLLAAAVSFPNLEILSSDDGCTTTDIRPCYDQGTKNKIKVLKDNAGTNAFSACIQNANPNTSGTFAMETMSCTEETVAYCMLGNSGNFIREFNGTCQDTEPPEPEPEPLPDLSEVNISGKFINGITKAPISNVRIWDPEIGMNTIITESSSSGDFSFTSNTTEIDQVSTLYTNYTTGCYFQNWGFTSISRNPDDSLRLKAVLFDFKPGDLLINPITKTDIELGNIPLWPAATLLLSSDIPVKVSISYPEENKVLGNNILQNDHKIWNAIPLEHPTTVRLTDQNGNVYNSPEVTLPNSDSCSVGRLNFTNREFTWQ